jgi:hypothetical protein
MDEKTYVIERRDATAGGTVWVQVGEVTTTSYYQRALQEWLDAESPTQGRYRVVEKFTSFGSRSMQEFDVTARVAYDVEPVVAEPPAVVES